MEGIGAKIFNFSSEILFGQLLWTFGDFSLVTLIPTCTMNGIICLMLQLKDCTYVGDFLLRGRVGEYR